MASGSKYVATETHHVEVEVSEGIGDETRKKYPASAASHRSEPYDSSSSSDTNVRCRVTSRAKKGNEVCLSMAIQKYSKQLADNLPFTDCELADEVVMRECITEDECKEVREKRDRKTQVRAILLLVKRRSYETMENFLDAAKIHCPIIVCDIWQQYHKNINDNRMWKPLCPLCNMKYSVNVRRVVDELWSTAVISDTLVDKINSGQDVVGLQDEYWDGILYACCKNRTKGLPTLYEALEKYGHYKHIAKQLRFHFRQNERLFCTCSSLNTCYTKSRTSSFNSVTSVEPTSSHSDDEITELGDGHGDESDTVVCPHISDDVEKYSAFDRRAFTRLSCEGNGSIGSSVVSVPYVVHWSACGNSVQISRNTYDPPRQNIHQRRRESKTPWWSRFVFFCGPASFTPIDEEEED